MLSLGIGLTVLVAVALVEANLSHEVETRMPAEAPAFFFIDIQPDQLAGFAAVVRATPGARFDQVPMMRGRITRLNGVPVEDAAVAPEAQWALRSDRGLTYAARLPQGSRLVAGTWWPPDYQGPPLVSFDDALARGMGLKVGDTLTVNLLGREITATIANLRSIDWERLGINFVLVFAPGTLEHAPQTHLAAVYLPQAEEEDLARAVTERFPNISAIHVREALAAVNRIIGMIGSAIRLTALVTVAAGVLVLGGAVAAGHRPPGLRCRRAQGVGRNARRDHAGFSDRERDYRRARRRGRRRPRHDCRLFSGDPADEDSIGCSCRPRCCGRWVLAALLTAALGFAGTWRALGAKPAPYLRNE